MFSRKIRETIKIDAETLIELTLIPKPSERQSSVEIRIRNPETNVLLELPLETASLIGSKLQFMAHLAPFLASLNQEETKPDQIMKKDDVSNKTRERKASLNQNILTLTRMPTRKNVRAIVKMLLRRFKKKNVTLTNLQQFYKTELTEKGLKIEEFEAAIGFLTISGIIHPESHVSQTGFKYWTFSFPQGDVPSWKARDLKNQLQNYLDSLKNIIHENRLQKARELVNLQQEMVQTEVLKPTNPVHQELFGPDFFVEVSAFPPLRIKLVTWSSDPLTWQVTHLMAWHFHDQQSIFSKLRETMVKRYDLPLIVIEHALEMLIDNKVVKIEERQAKAGHHYKVYHFPDELIILLDEALDLSQQITMLGETIKKINTNDS